MTEFTTAPQKLAVTADLLDRLDVRVGTITAVHDIPESKKLRLSVDFGDHTRTILVGMKTERRDPTAVLGTRAG